MEQVLTMPAAQRRQLLRAYRRSTRRLLLLDYDGTLVPFSPRPEGATPDGQLLTLLRDLANTAGNRLVIVSGRDRHTLERWLGHLDLALAAEHGAWTRLPGQPWHAADHLRRDWQAAVRPLLDRLTANTPGALVEEKTFGLAWHYRQAEPDQARAQVVALKRDLDPLAARLQLSVLYGNKVVEIKDSRVNKGQVAAAWLPRDAWDFILAVGDDTTDEDLFAALPPAAPAYTIKVGSQATRARYALAEPNAVRNLLAELAMAPAAAPPPLTDPVN